MTNDPAAKAASELRRNPRPLPDWSAYKMHLTRNQINQVIHYGHWIPITRGYTYEFFAKNYPGWCLNGFFAVFEAAGIRMSGGIGDGGRCHWQVKSLHFDSVDSFVVEWNEGVTADDGRHTTSKPRRGRA